MQFLDAVSRMASLGFEKSYRETVVLMTRSYLSKLSNAASSPPEGGGGTLEATTERLEVLIFESYLTRNPYSSLSIECSLVQLHSRLFPQDFFLLLVDLPILNCVQITATVYSLSVQM